MAGSKSTGVKRQNLSFPRIYDLKEKDKQMMNRMSNHRLYGWVGECVIFQS